MAEKDKWTVSFTLTSKSDVKPTYDEIMEVAAKMGETAVL